MNTQLKQRLIGVVILIIFLAIAIPFLMSGSKKPQKPEASTATETSATTEASASETLKAANNAAPTLPNHQPTIQFNTPEGKTIANQKPALNTEATATTASDSNAIATEVAQPTAATEATNEKQNKAAGENQPPVFQHQPTDPSVTSNIAMSNTPPKTATSTIATDDTETDAATTAKASTPAPAMATRSRSTNTPANTELQQSITQKETAIISNTPIANKHHAQSPHQAAKTTKPKIKSSQPPKPKTITHKKKPKPIPATENTGTSSTDNDLQRLLNQEKAEMHKSKPKINHKNNDDLVDPDI